MALIQISRFIYFENSLVSSLFEPNPLEMEFNNFLQPEHAPKHNGTKLINCISILKKMIEQQLIY